MTPRKQEGVKTALVITGVNAGPMTTTTKSLQVENFAETANSAMLIDQETMSACGFVFY